MSAKSLIVPFFWGALLLAKVAGAHPAPGQHPDGEWLKDPQLATAMLHGLCMPGFIGGSGELSGFEPCSSQQITEIENCAWFNGTDDEGGNRFLTNPVEVTGLNAVLYDEVCVGGDHCSPAWNVGRAMLFASDDTADIFLWDGWEPVKLIGCEDVQY